MKIGLLGGTSLAKTLGKKLIDAGIQTVFGVRYDFDTQQPDWKALNKMYNRICPYESAIIQSDIILICAEAYSLPEICVALKNTDTDGKLIIDCSTAEQHSKLTLSNTTLIQKSAPKASLFKAFNNLGMDYPQSDIFGKIKETYFCGEETPAKLRVKRLIEMIGFKAIDADKLPQKLHTEEFYQLGRELTWNIQESSFYQLKRASG